MAKSKPKTALIKAPVAAAELVAEPVMTVPTRRRALISGFSEPPNLSTQMDEQRIQSALRTAERGDTWMLMTIYRDMILGYSHLQAEWAKRKMVIVGQPHALIPPDKDNADDVVAAEVIQDMIDHCENWDDALTHMLDATLYPVSASEKIFQPMTADEAMEFRHPVRFSLKRIDPVNYMLLCFRLPYAPTFNASPMVRAEGGYLTFGSVNPATVYDADSWEPDLRFYDTLPSGMIDYSLASVYAPERIRHIIHRGDILSRSIRDNMGGPMRAILFWWLLSMNDRDWFGRFMQKYGAPFLLGKADAQNKDTVEFLRTAFATAVQIGGLVIDKRAEAELIQAASQDGANAHKTLITVCNDEVSKLTVGQVLSSSAKNTGLGSGVADLHGEVRQDFRLFDMKKLSSTLKRQLFRPYLRMNGYRGRVPDILWGGEKEGDAIMLSQSTNQFAQAGIVPTDEGIETISKRVGYGLRRKTKEDFEIERPPVKEAFGGGQSNN